MDSSTINKLIPQLFEEMRSNLGRDTADMNQSSQNSTITTQSLLKELEVLDKIIPMVESVDNSLRISVPQHLDRINEICKSTNTMLDSWINIQSQADYIYKLMSSPNYIEHASAQLREPGVASEELLAAEIQKNDTLKKQLKEEQDKNTLRNNAHSGLKQETPRRPTSTSRISKPTAGYDRSRAGRTSTPNVTERLARPTASSTRKMFR